MTLLSEQAYRKIDRELTKFPPDQRLSAAIAALAIAQDEKGWISTEVIDDVARYLRVPAIAVQEVATFYDMFDTEPVGRHKITVCTNLSCALRDAMTVVETIKERLGIDFNETTPDGAFTLKEGECMGSCGDAPVLLVNNKRMCVQMNDERINALLDELQADGGAQ